MAESTPTYHMLIVEDDADVAQALQDFFRAAGLSRHACTGGT
ncbi:hypothetical protein [Rhodothermus marinus]|nr:hypothetical protein [Rhodothermus marinus]